MTVYSLIWAPRVPDFTEQVTVVRSPDRPTAQPTAIRSDDVLIVSGAVGLGGRYENLVTARRLQRRHPGLGIVVSDATWHPRSVPAESRAGRLRWVLTTLEQRLLLSLDPDRTRYCFLTEEERESFVEESGVPADRVVVTPFFATIRRSDDLEELLELARHPEPFVFSGGNAIRDYDLLREALGGTDIPVRIATKNASRRAPANFTEGPVPHKEFMRLMARSQIVVMPLNSAAKRSAGQQSYLNAMRLGKPTIVNDAIGVRTLTDGGAFVVPAGDAAALRDRVRWVLDPANHEAVQRVVARGQELACTVLTQERYFLQLLEIAQELHGRTRTVAPSHRA